MGNGSLELTQSRLKEFVAYDAETGLFTRVKPVAGLQTGDPAGTAKGDGYVRVGVAGRLYHAHRIAWLYTYGHWPVGDIDHINGNRSDNRIANLRDVDRSRNLQNVKEARSNSKSGLLGAAWIAARGKYQANITVDGKARSLGRFDTAEQAHAAYMAAKRTLHAGNTL